MGKDLLGNELGVGITQRSWGSYFARYMDSNGVRFGKNFKTIEECKAWIERSIIVDKYVGKLQGSSYTVRSWFQYYIELIKKPVLKERSSELYTSLFQNHIDPIIGKMRLTAVKPLHCQKVLDIAVKKKLSDESVKKIRSVMRDMFVCAFDYDYIASNPVNRSVQMYRSESIKGNKTAMSITEQQAFLLAARDTKEYSAYALILQTGVRIGELCALQWKDINFKKKMIQINRTGRYKSGEFTVNTPKTRSSKRKIPMTRKCEEVLLAIKEDYDTIPDTPHKQEGYVFLNKHGRVVSSAVYKVTMDRIIDMLDMPRFTLHSLRHTFATRCIEAGMRPKTLQVLLGHASVSFTMNLYVHVTQEQKEKEVQRIAKRLLCVDGEQYGT